MEKYTTPVKQDLGSAEINEWYKLTYVNNPSWFGGQLVTVIGKDGKKTQIPRKDVALLFSEFKMKREGNTDITSYYGDVGGNAVVSKFVGLVSGNDTFVPAFSDVTADKKKHILTSKRVGWIPWIVH